MKACRQTTKLSLCLAYKGSKGPVTDWSETRTEYYVRLKNGLIALQRICLSSRVSYS